MRRIRLALCQFAPIKGDVAANRARSLEWLDRAGAAGANLVIFPELATTGYTCGEAFLDLAEPVPGPTTEAWGAKARQYGYYVIGGLARRDPNLASLVYNGAVLIGPDGGVAGEYSKVVLPLYLHTLNAGDGSPVMIEEAEIFRRGDSLPVFSTAFGKIGIQICQDAVYPEFTRVMAFKGADLIVQILNGPAMPTAHEDDFTEVTTRVHAFDSGVFIALCNRTGSEEFSYNGQPMQAVFGVRSHVCDPGGNFVARAEAGREELLVADIDLDEVRQAQWATKFIRDWRPELLGALVRRGVTMTGEE